MVSKDHKHTAHPRPRSITTNNGDVLFGVVVLFLLASSDAFLLRAVSLRCRTSFSFSSLGMIVSADEYGPMREGSVDVLRGSDHHYSLFYRLYNPDSKFAPLVVLHGGPSLPSQYLYPLVPLLQRRPILFYDQLGCGKSDSPSDLSCYSISQFVDDLEIVLSETLSFRTNDKKKVHLLGHSFGGVLAYEYAKRSYNFPHSPATVVQSLILSNAITNMKIGFDEYLRLEKEKPETFWVEHVCRIGIPPPLQNAIEKAGSVWGGMDAVEDYVAEKEKISDNGNNDNDKLFPPTLVLSGSNDFCYKVSNEEAWKPLIPSSKRSLTAVNFQNGGHYLFYEDGPEYGVSIEKFIVANE